MLKDMCPGYKALRRSKASSNSQKASSSKPSKPTNLKRVDNLRTVMQNILLIKDNKQFAKNKNLLLCGRISITKYYMLFSHHQHCDYTMEYYLTVFTKSFANSTTPWCHKLSLADTTSSELHATVVIITQIELLSL
jgi:hypothetical protein